MEAKTFTKIKYELAIKYGYEDWTNLETSLQKKEIGELFEEAAELYAKQIALAACEKQREICAEYAESIEGWNTGFSGSADSVDKDSILNAPLAITID